MLCVDQGLKYLFFNTANSDSGYTPSQSSRGKHGKIFHIYNGMETLLLHFRGFRFNT